MNKKLQNLASWLKENFFLKESKKVVFILKIASSEDLNKLFLKFQKLETMFLASEKSEDEGTRKEGQLARRMSERLKDKFQEKTGRNFDDAYAEWKQGSTGIPEESIGSRYEKYDWRNYYNEMDEILNSSGFFASQEHPTPGQYEARLDHIVKDYINGTLPREEAIRLLGEGEGEWLDEMASEMRAEKAISGEWAAEQREYARTEALGHPSWMSPNDLRELEEAEFESDWRNRIEIDGVGDLLYTLDYDKREDSNQPGLVKSEPSSLVRIQESPYSEAIMVKREDLLSPDAPQGNYNYGVTKLEYAKEYMQKQLDEVIYPADYSSFNEEMDNLVNNTGDLFFRFQNYESEESIGGNDLTDHLRDHLNNKSKDIAKQIEVLYNHIWRKITPDRYRVKRSIKMPYFKESWSRDFYSNRIKALLRYLNDVETESAGRPFSRPYRALLKSKYPYAYYSDNLENIYKELYEYAVPLDGRQFNEEELRAEYSEFLNKLKDKYKDTFKSCLPNI